MPPRHTYWTILFGDKPTAFRSATQEELLPTFKQIQAKHADAVMMWFARGKLWRSEEEAGAAFERPRFDRPRGPRPESFGRSAKPAPEWLGPPKARRDEGGQSRGPKPAWQNRGPKPEWPGPPAKPFGGGGKPRGDEEGRDKPRFDRPPSAEGGRPAWKDTRREDRPQGDRPRGPRPEWKNRGGDSAKPAWRDKPQGDRPRGPKPEWQNRGPKPKWSAPPPASPKGRSDEGGREKPHSDRPRGPKPEWRDKPQGDRPSGPRPDWKNRGGDSTKPVWRDKPSSDRPRGPKPAWRDKPQGDRSGGPRPPAFTRKPSGPGDGAKPAWRDKPQGDRPRGPRPEWKDKATGDAPASDKRGRSWRPGGAHKDPRDRFKVPRDVKRARFKDKLRRDRTNLPPRKKKDEE